MRKFITLILVFIAIQISAQCNKTDIQHAYLTVSMNESMTISDAIYSLSDTTKVNFAVGNLMYRPSTDTWKLADHQYDFVGGIRKEATDAYLEYGKHYGTVWDTINGEYKACQNTGGLSTSLNVIDPDYDGWIDLFPSRSTKTIHFKDTIHNLEYRTPTKEEFQYLVGGFEIAGDTIGRKDYRKLRARGRILVNDSMFVNGLILLPDMPDSCSSVEECILKIMPDGVSFKSDYDSCWYYWENEFTAAQWNVLEKQGAVFLPATGGYDKGGKKGIKYNRSGFYWTWNTDISLEFGGYPYKENGQWQNSTPIFKPSNGENRRAIRVVSCEQKTTTTSLSTPKTCRDYKWGTGLIETVGGVIEIDSVDECTYSLTAVPKNGYKFAYFKDLGSIYFEDSVTLNIDTTIQNYVYEATFVRDNSFIYKWLDDSIIIRTDTTDLLSECNNSGWSYTLVDGEKRMTDEDERITKLDWGIWKSDVSELINRNEYAGLPLHMIIHNHCNKPSAVIDTIIPVVVHDTMYAHTMKFPSTPHTDLQVLEDAVLYVDSTVTISGILDVHEGGKVVIDKDRTLTAQGIILRGDGTTKKWAQLLIKGEIINISEPLIYYDYTLNSSEYYPLSLPDTVTHSSIVSSITGTSTYYTSFWYNTELRNTHHTGWEAVDSDYMLGNGYIIYSPVNRWKNNVNFKQKTNIIRYPIRVWLSNETQNKSIHVVGETHTDILPSDRNWNLIGNPYISDYKVGYEDGVVSAIWHNDKTLQYITYSNDGYLTYEQDLLEGFVIKPFNSYFIQVENSEDITFERENLVYYYLPKKESSRSELRTGITLTQENRTEHIGLLYGDYTDEYEINADLAKMFGSTPVMYAYSLANREALAFQAVSIDSLYSIPVGYRNASTSAMKFAFDSERYTNTRLSAIWLYDSKLNEHINLLKENYEFNPYSSNEDTRFYVTVEFDISVDLDYTSESSEGLVFDVLGRRMSNTPNKGMYVLFKNEKYIKVVR